MDIHPDMLFAMLASKWKSSKQQKTNVLPYQHKNDNGLSGVSKVDLYLFKNSCKNIASALQDIEAICHLKLPDMQKHIIESELSSMVMVIERNEAKQ